MISCALTIDANMEHHFFHHIKMFGWEGGGMKLSHLAPFRDKAKG